MEKDRFANYKKYKYKYATQDPKGKQPKPRQKPVTWTNQETKRLGLPQYQSIFSV